MASRNPYAKLPATNYRWFTGRLSRPPMVMALIAGLLIAISAPAIEAQTNSSAATEPGTEALDIVYPDWFKTSFMELEEDIQEARDAGKRLMLVFHQPGCPYCNAFVERNLAQKDIEETVKSNFDVIEINMWGDLEVIDVGGNEFTEKTFARHLKVQFTPTVLMYDQNGAIAMRINGYFPPDKFRAALDYVIKEDTKKQSFNEYLSSLNQTTEIRDTTDYAYIDTDDFGTDKTISLPEKNTDKPYILLFEQNDCSNCLQLHDTVLANDDISELLQQFDIIRLDMWGKDKVELKDSTHTTGRELAKKLRVNYAPTLVLYSADHNEVIRSESWLKYFHTSSILNYVLSDEWRTQPSLQNYIRDRADAIREDGGTVNILE